MVLLFAPIVALIVLAVSRRRLFAAVRRTDWPAWMLRVAADGLHGDREQWGRAMLAELASIEDPMQRWRFALSAARVALLPPSRRGFHPALVAAMVAGGAWAGAAAFFPRLQVFVVVFAVLLGGYLSWAVAGRRVPRVVLRSPWIVVVSVVLLGVVACVGLAARAASAYPRAVDDPLHLFALVFAVVLAGYVALAVTPPRAAVSQPAGRWAGAAAGLGAVAVWVVPMLLSRSADWLSGPAAWLTVVVAVTVAAGFAAGISRSPNAGVLAGLWTGLVGAPLVFVLGLAASLHAAQTAVADKLTMDAFHQSGLPDLPTYLVSDDLGGLILMLVWLPLWTTAFGAVAGLAAAAVRERTAA
ncbi:hypothetical protein [Kribbella sp. NPDC004536]|uniref:hypothetical protein n=1 Tax=Kribbella sp. NPDC004536 TaxID=3364106 RepID=UPI0036827719